MLDQEEFKVRANMRIGNIARPKYAVYRVQFDKTCLFLFALGAHSNKRENLMFEIRDQTIVANSVGTVDAYSNQRNYKHFFLSLLSYRKFKLI